MFIKNTWIKVNSECVEIKTLLACILRYASLMCGVCEVCDRNRWTRWKLKGHIHLNVHANNCLRYCDIRCTLVVHQTHS